MTAEPNSLCAVCGAAPCYGICPTQCPWQGDHALENEEHEFHYHREAFDAEHDTEIE